MEQQLPSLGGLFHLPCADLQQHHQGLRDVKATSCVLESLHLSLEMGLMGLWQRPAEAAGAAPEHGGSRVRQRARQRAAPGNGERWTEDQTHWYGLVVLEVRWGARLSRDCGGADGQTSKKPPEDSPTARWKHTPAPRTGLIPWH